MERVVLDNGAVVIAKRTEATPAVTIHAALRAGTVDDPPGRPGLAHFVSRTIDRGTPRRSCDVIAEELDGRGVSLAITVNRHVTSLVCTCLAEDFEATLAVIGDIVRDPSFPEEEVAVRRGEIVTLIRQDDDNPAVVAVEGLLTDLYGPTHPYGRRVRGSVDSVETIDRPSLLRFHADRFAPSSLSLVLVGDVEPSRAVDVAVAVFGDWNAIPSPPAALPDQAPGTGRRVRVIPMMNKAQVDIAYGFIGIRRSAPEYEAYWLLNNILGQYALGGRLGDRIRERQGMAYYVFSALDASVIPGPLMVRAGVAPSNVERAIASIDEEVAALAADGPAERELAESKQYLIGSIPRMLETNAGIAAFLQTGEFFGLGLDYDVRMPVLLGAVTRDDVHAAARATLIPARAAVVIAGPYAGGAQ